MKISTKKANIIVAAGMAGVILTACAGTTAITPATEATTGTESTVTETETDTEGVVNFPSFEKLSDAMGLEPIRLADTTEYVPFSYDIIDGTIAQISYESEKDKQKTVCVRSAFGEEDITGSNGLVTYETENINGYEVQKGYAEQYQAMWFVKNGHSYSAVAAFETPDDFDTVMDYMTRMADQIVGDVTRDGKILTVCYEENATTGYSWEYLIEDEKVLHFVSDQTEAGDTNLAGAPGTHTFEFEGVGEGTTSIVLTYKQPWAGGDTGNIKVIEVTVNKDGVIMECSHN